MGVLRGDLILTYLHTGLVIAVSVSGCCKNGIVTVCK